MGKKRRVWWIVGGVLAVLCAALIVGSHSPGTGAERALEGIIDEYAFELDYREDRSTVHSGIPTVTDVYVGDLIRPRDEDEAVGIIRKAFPGWKHSGRDGWHIFINKRPRKGSIATIEFMPYADIWHGSSSLEVTRYAGSPSAREKYEALWPW